MAFTPNLVAAFNLAEAGLWAVFAASTATLGHRVTGMTPWLRVSLSMSFLAFGASDLVEVTTGAWWRPPLLLALKGACLAGIIISFWLIQRHRKRSTVTK